MPAKQTSEPKAAAAKERIAKRIAASGYCSRRQAERLIEQGKVKLNGSRVETPATLVSHQDVIHINGKPIADAPSVPRMWLYHKPAGLLTTHDDPKGRPTVFEHLPKNLPRVISIGRLDYNTEGLLLLTTSGAISRAMELPKTGLKRSYRVRVSGMLEESKKRALEKGVTINGMRYKPATITIDPEKQGRNQWLMMTLTEGKNREVRELCAFAGLEVSRLIRDSYGSFKLGNLASGKVKEVSQARVEALMQFLKIDGNGE